MFIRDGRKIQKCIICVTFDSEKKKQQQQQQQKQKEQETGGFLDPLYFVICFSNFPDVR